ncbi:GntR family transcriptional regulator [Cellulomonas sp. ATA003]|uniref:GntR family transcriptional regulator n=1 Tax=Cellulomonas sp. ATA003 TaxID=3073064 RepID=UPI002872EBD8|nr:GntR family transcriptional regulator [Cellulomonas sp. ATA003]WNB86269.1 GntR family transcriptional regulator [Cellulomonas sp. ATA003]
MMLVVDPASHVPPYEQVQRQIEELVADGTLAPEHRLPTVRRLAGDLGLAVNTVARAYRELEQAGVVQTRGRHGTFVATRGRDRDREGALAAQQYARRLRELGFDVDGALRMVRDAFG